MELIEIAFIISIVILSSVSVLLLSGKTGSKRVTKDTTVGAWKEVSKEKENVIQELKSELVRTRGKVNRQSQMLQQYEEGITESNEEDEPEVNLEDVKPLLKTIIPNASDMQIAAAMQIPQVKELLGSIGTTKNMELIKQIAPLLTKKNNDQTQNQDMSNWA